MAMLNVIGGWINAPSALFPPIITITAILLPKTWIWHGCESARPCTNELKVTEEPSRHSGLIFWRMAWPERKVPALRHNDPIETGRAEAMLSRKRQAI